MNIASCRCRVLVAAALLTATGCRHEQSYFPLDAGWRYGYRMNLESDGTAGIEILKSAAVNLPPRTIGTIRATPRLFEDGRILYYAEDATGLRAVGFQLPGEEATIAAPDQYLLKYPLQTGAHWRTSGRTVLLTQRFLYSKALPITIEIDLDYSIEKVDETVRVPAGLFTNCLKVVAAGRTSVTTADNQQTLEVGVDIVEWYAPGVGLIKSMRAEHAGEERAGNARLSSELEYLATPRWFEWKLGSAG